LWKASPYLFPCVIEYSLIAAAVMYKIATDVGLRASPDTSRSDEQDGEKDNVDCQKVGGHCRNLALYSERAKDRGFHICRPTSKFVKSHTN